MARRQYYMVEQIRHRYEIADCQYKPDSDNTKKYPTQLIQMIPEGHFCHCLLFLS